MKNKSEYYHLLSMGINKLKEQPFSFRLGRSEKPIIEKHKLEGGDERTFTISIHLIVFIMKGRIKCYFKGRPNTIVQRGEVLLIAPGTYTHKTLKTSQLIFFRVNGPISSYMKIASDRVNKEENRTDRQKNTEVINPNSYIKQPGQLNINSRLWIFIHGVNFCISYWAEHQAWAALKLQEFFLIVQTSYPQKDIQNFLYTIHSEDKIFSEYIHLHWKEYNTVQELANSMHMTTKRFSARFLSVFGVTPHRWIMHKRAYVIYQEITTTSKLFKQIAIENGFSSDSLLTRFCKKIFNLTPTQIREGQ